MRTTNLDDTLNPVLSNEDIFKHLKFLFFSPTEELDFQKFTNIAALVDRITDRQLLDGTVKFLIKNGFGLREKPEWVEQLSASRIYTETDLVKIEARSYSLQITFLLYKSMNSLLNSELRKLQNCEPAELTAIPDLSIHVNGRTITDNSEEANDFIRKKMVRGMKTHAEALPTDEGKSFLSDVAISYANVELDLNDPGFFKNEISYISTVKENLTTKAPAKPAPDYSFLHLNVFTEGSNGFALWEHLMENYVSKGRGRTSDIAFFYRRMSDSERFIYQPQEVFKKWFKKVYGEELGQFAKRSTIQNERDYSEALDWHKKFNSQ